MVIFCWNKQMLQIFWQWWSLVTCIRILPKIKWKPCKSCGHHVEEDHKCRYWKWSDGQKISQFFWAHNQPTWEGIRIELTSGGWKADVGGNDKGQICEVVSNFGEGKLLLIYKVIIINLRMRWFWNGMTEIVMFLKNATPRPYSSILSILGRF